MQFTGRVYQQKMGIPMGISPAVFISNYYLHTYEYDFYAQLRPMQAAAARSLAFVSALRAMMVSGAPPPGGSADVAALVLDSFAYTARYIDDMYSLANPILEHLTYTNQQWFGLHGLYPPSLNLAVAHHGAEVIYMDMRISMSVKYVPYAYSSRAIVTVLNPVVVVVQGHCTSVKRVLTPRSCDRYILVSEPCVRQGGREWVVAGSSPGEGASRGDLALGGDECNGAKPCRGSSTGALY